MYDFSVILDIIMCITYVFVRFKPTCVCVSFLSVFIFLAV